MLKVSRYLFTTAILLISITGISAQDIYTTEIGIHGGGSYFTGDFKSAPQANIKPDFGVTLRYLFNQRLSLMADYHNTELKGTFQQPLDILESTEIALDQKINMLDLCLAINFFDYGQLDYILKSSNFTAFIMGGIGIVEESKGIDGSRIHFSIPFGMGFKLKLSERWHLNLQWTHRLLPATDGLEGNRDFNNPLGLNGSNIFNNDNAGTCTLGISYSLFKRNCKCMNYH